MITGGYDGFIKTISLEDYNVQSIFSCLFPIQEICFFSDEIFFISGDGKIYELEKGHISKLKSHSCIKDITGMFSVGNQLIIYGGNGIQGAKVEDFSTSKLDFSVFFNDKIQE